MFTTSDEMMLMTAILISVTKFHKCILNSFKIYHSTFHYFVPVVNDKLLDNEVSILPRHYHHHGAIKSIMLPLHFNFDDVTLCIIHEF